MDLARHDPHGLALTSILTTVGSSIHQRAAQIAVPTMLVVGEREKRFVDARRDTARIDCGAGSRAGDAGHIPNLADPETFNAAVARFFARHRSAG